MNAKLVNALATHISNAQEMEYEAEIAMHAADEAHKKARLVTETAMAAAYLIQNPAHLARARYLASHPGRQTLVVPIDDQINATGLSIVHFHFEGRDPNRPAGTSASDRLAAILALVDNFCDA